MYEEEIEKGRVLRLELEEEREELNKEIYHER